MRALAIVLVAAACTPEIVSGSYLCGRNATCPESQVCDGLTNICVHPGGAIPFACEADIDTEPDDEPLEAHAIDLGCDSVGEKLESCLLEGDGGDWVRFVAPTTCGDRGVDVRVTFPIAFERVGLELWDLDANERIAQDIECPSAGVAGEDVRCLQADLVAGTSYGVQVLPTGIDNCDGACAYNRYTLRMQLTLPR